MEDRARRRLRQILPRSRSRSRSPQTLPHLRSTTPPLTASYSPTSTIHRDLTSFVLDPAIQHAFTSTNITELEGTATELVAGEAALRKAFGGLWRVLEGDVIGKRDAAAYAAANGAGSSSSMRSTVVPEDSPEDGAMDEDEGPGGGPNGGSGGGGGGGITPLIPTLNGLPPLPIGADENDFEVVTAGGRRSGSAAAAVAARALARQQQHAQSLPPLHKLFVSPVSIPLPGPEPRTFLSPQSQIESLEWALGVLRELADDGKEYTSRLEEIRDGLGHAGAVRGAVWRECRVEALEEMMVDGM